MTELTDIKPYSVPDGEIGETYAKSINDLNEAVRELQRMTSPRPNGLANALKQSTHEIREKSYTVAELREKLEEYHRVVPHYAVLRLEGFVDWLELEA